MIWRLAPKHLNSGLKIVEIASYIAARIFNEGYFFHSTNYDEVTNNYWEPDQELLRMSTSIRYLDKSDAAFHILKKLERPEKSNY